MGLPDLSIRRPVATAMVYVAVAVVGVVSFTRLPIDLLPDVSFPTLSVWTTYPDAGPSEVERFVTEPVESSLSRVPGVRRVDSRSREGQSLVRLQFYWGTDMEFAMLHVRERLDNLVDALPESAERPSILNSDPTNDPIMTLAVGGADLGELRDLTNAVFKRRLEQLDGVALAAMTGGPVREIQVSVDAGALATHDVAIAAVIDALDRANYSAPGGTIRRGRFRYSLRTLGEFQSVEDLEGVVVQRSESGTVVRLRDVATVREGIAERETLARFNGGEAIGLQIYKESGSNTVRVADGVRDVLDQLAVEFPEVTIDVAADQAGFISNAISNVVQALLFGGILAFLVLFLFLRDPRYPVAIGLAIPLSVSAAFALCYAFDVSLNVMSLGGLALGVGMLVDNSIVVLENIFRHRNEEGGGARESASVGAGEVTGAIVASTLTTIAVFGPVLYVKGVAGALFKDLSLAVTFSLMASLLVALTLLPVLSARFSASGGGSAADEDVAEDRHASKWRMVRWTRAARGGFARLIRFILVSVQLTLRDIGHAVGRVIRWLSAPTLRGFDRQYARFEVRYERALEWSLEHRTAVIGLAFGALVLAVVVGSALPRGLMPDVDEGAFRVELNLPVGTPIEATSDAAGRLEEILGGLEGVSAVFTRVGRAREAELATRDLTGLNSAAIDVRLGSGAPPAREVVERFRSRIPGTGLDPNAISIETGQATSLGRALGLGEADLAVRVRGQELDSLIAVAESAAVRMAGLDRIADVRLDMQLTQPELEIQVDRAAAARYGFTVTEVADAIESFLRGEETDRQYTEFSEKIDIRVALPIESRRQLSDVLGMTHEDIPIRELVTVRQGYGPVEIRRSDQNRTVQVLAEVAGGGLATAVVDVENILAGLELPVLTTLEVGGENEEMRDSFRSLMFAFILALFLVFLIMAAKFESIIQPVVVLVSVPLAAIGTVLALALAGDGINAMSGIGFVILIGIVVNDAIIKVDFINQRRDVGHSKRDAILQAGRLRLRPILMTTITTVFGLFPMALGWGAGADLRAPLAVAVIGGLISATFLTLIVVPVVYSLLVTPAESVSAGSIPRIAHGISGAPDPAPAADPA